MCTCTKSSSYFIHQPLQRHAASTRHSVCDNIATDACHLPLKLYGFQCQRGFRFLHFSTEYAVILCYKMHMTHTTSVKVNWEIAERRINSFRSTGNYGLFFWTRYPFVNDWFWFESLSTNVFKLIHSMDVSKSRDSSNFCKGARVKFAQSAQNSDSRASASRTEVKLNSHENSRFPNWHLKRNLLMGSYESVKPPSDFAQK